MMKAEQWNGTLSCDVRGCGRAGSVRVRFDDNPANSLILCEGCARELEKCLSGLRKKEGRHE